MRDRWKGNQRGSSTNSGGMAGTARQGTSPNSARAERVKTLEQGLHQLRQLKEPHGSGGGEAMQQLKEQVDNLTKEQQQGKVYEATLRTLKVVGGAVPAAGPGGKSDVRSRVREALGRMEVAHVSIEDARAVKDKKGQDVLIFRLHSMQDAELVRRERKKLKGCGYAVVDELTKEEFSTFKRLQPQWEAAKKAKQRTWWVRSRLFIDGKEVRETKPVSTPSSSRGDK